MPAFSLPEMIFRKYPNDFQDGGLALTFADEQRQKAKTCRETSLLYVYLYYRFIHRH